MFEKSSDHLTSTSFGHHGKSITLERVGSGYILENGILSLNSPDAAIFNFSCNPVDVFESTRRQPGQKQTLMSQETFDQIKWKGLPGNFLPCPFFRPISLGSLTVELRPSGAGCGSSLLYAEKKGASLLYAKEWLLTEYSALRGASPRPADHLVLSIDHRPGERTHMRRKKELERFGSTCQAIVQAGSSVVAVSPGYGPSHVLLQKLTELGIPCLIDLTGYKVLEALQLASGVGSEPSPSWLQKTRKTSQALAKSSDPAVILLTKEALKAVRRTQLPQATWLWVGSDLESHSYARPSWLEKITFSDIFRLDFNPDLQELLKLIDLTSPRQITLQGPYAQDLHQDLEKLGIPVSAHQPLMQTLF